LNDDLADFLQISLASGDPQDCEKFIALAQPVIASAILRVLSRWKSIDRQRVDDLVQDTFARLYERNASALRSVRCDGSPMLAAWLRTVAASVALDFLRSRAAQKHGSGKEERDVEDPNLNLPSSEDTFATVDRTLLMERIGRCLQPQSVRDRSIFWLYYRQGFTARDIAQIPAVGMKVKGVETTLFRVTRAVRDCVRNTLVAKAAAAEGNRE
jgi:RNA polymerase sigma-70 factor (ECF subfamily)